MPANTVSFYDIRILYLRELRSALRERGILVNSILIPLFLYPVMLWLMLTGLSFVRGQQERFVSRIALVDLPSAHEDLRQTFADDESIELVEASPDWQEAIAAGDLDAVAEFLPPGTDAAALEGNFLLRLGFDASKDRSQKARQRVNEALDDYREAWLERSSETFGLGLPEWQRFRIERFNVATGSEMGAFILGIFVPLLMVIMIALGCFYPAVDATAGERERSTWETLMTVSASRTSVVVAKYLYVATLGGLAGLLNLVALTVTMRSILAPMLSDTSTLDFQLPLTAMPLLALSAVLLAMFIAAGMMILAAFARTFKEGQSMVGPLYMLCILPTILVQSPDLELTPKMALVPIANVVLMFRELIGGIYKWPLIGLTLLAQAAIVALCLALARYVLSFEDILLGSFNGSFGKFFKSRILRRSGSPEVAS
ncbi:MAG: ABC transporter permease subunit [Acidobacteriota bacterium]